MTAAAALASLMLAAGPLAAGQERPRFRAAGALAHLPSRPGLHVEKLRGMNENSWLLLGPPAPDPKWGRARGRSWTPRMPYAPDLRAALLCGCGQHGYVKPDGHFMDDLWAYDIHAHRWVCVYPGANVKTLKLRLDEHGFEVNAAGEHVPVSYLGHGYCNQTYIAPLNRFMVLYTHNPWWTRAIPQRWTWLDASDRDVRRRNYGHAGPVIENPRHPLFYDVAAGRWRRTFVGGAGPGPRGFEGVLEYIPSRKQVFCLYRGRVWFYDPAAARWIDSGAKRVDIGYDSNGCYDSRRKCVYVVRKEGFWAFDIEANRWREIHGRAQPDDLSNCHAGAIAYDPGADAVVWLSRRLAGIRIYRPATNAWSEAAPPPKAAWKRRNVNAFYDPVLGVHFYHLAGDSYDDGTILVYRCARAAAGPER